MTKTLLSTRSFSLVAATGLASVALAGCGALGGGDTTTTETTEAATTEAATTEEATTEEATTEEATTEEATTDDAATDGAIEGVDTTPFTEEQKAAGTDTFISFMNAAVDGDWETACGNVAGVDNGKIMKIENPAEAKICASAAESEAGGEIDPAQADAVRQMLTPENITIEDNGDGTAAVLLMDSELGIDVIKLDSGEVLIDLTDETM